MAKIELKDKRSLNAKHFDTDGVKSMEAHAGHIHYFDKLDSGRLREIDFTLLFDEVKRGWYFNYHSFRPFLPEYADEWVEFRDLFEDKDQTVKYKAVCNRVKGELIETDETNPRFDDNPDNKGVLYKNAFGENRDYLLYHTRSQLIKVATVNNPNEQTADAVFEWEIELPEKEVFRVEKRIDAEEMTQKATKTNTEDGKLVGYKLLKYGGKNLNTSKLTLIGDSKLDGKEWYTYLKTFKAWDSEGNEIDIVARIYFEDGKVYLRKTVPVEFLKTAVGRVFTDTTTSYYAGGGDTRIAARGSNNSQAQWDAAHDATSGFVQFSADSILGGCNSYADSTNKIGIQRGMIPFDTSGLPESITISSASLNIYIDSKYTSDNGDYSYVTVVQATPANSSSPSLGDFDEIGDTIDNPTEGVDTSGRKTISSISTSAYLSFTLNSTGIGWIDTSGTTVLGLRQGNDVEDVYPTFGANDKNGIDSAQSEYTGTSRDPYLSITYTEGGGGGFAYSQAIFI